MNILSSREAAIRAVMEAAAIDERIVLVSPDAVLAGRMVPFLEKYPERLIEVGIAEQDAVDVAAGLAASGMRPIVISYAGFLTMRACEMIRTFIAYPGLNVKLIGLNGGMLGGEREGVTHQFYEDVGILRSMPGVKIITPADAHQTYKACKEMLDLEGPCYLRLASGREPEVFDENTPFAYGKARTVLDYGTDVAVFASGFIMSRAIEAVNQLKEQGIGARLVDISTIKPLDVDAVTQAFKECGCAVTVEDHNIYGGLGSAVAEVACDRHPCRVIRVGLNDEYPRSGHADQLLNAYGLSVKDIVDGAKRAMGN